MAITATMAAGWHLEPPGYDIWAIPNSGSSLDLNDGSYFLQDIKGYPFGLFFGSQMMTGVGVFTATGEGGGETDLVDTGWIRDTNIERVGNDLKITWDYDPLEGPVAVEIYRRKGVGAVYEEDADTFYSIGDVPAGTKFKVDAGKAADSFNYYYRVIPDVFPHTPIFSTEKNSITVGKVSIDLPANKYVFCGRPFMEDYYMLSDILGGQVGADGEFLWWDGSVYRGATYQADPPQWVGEDNTMRIGEGFLVRAQTTGRMALVGRFCELATPIVRNFTVDQYDLIVYPYPINREFNNIGITPHSDDEIYSWDLADQVFQGNTYSSPDWIGTPDISLLTLSDPRFYRPKSANSWSIQAP